MIMGTYGEKTFTKKTGLEDLSEHNGEIYINETDFRRLYEKGSYQASVFVDDTRNINGMKDMLDRGGFEILAHGRDLACVVDEHGTVFNILARDGLYVSVFDEKHSEFSFIFQCRFDEKLYLPRQRYEFYAFSAR
jgi:hypothetical protein